VTRPTAAKHRHVFHKEYARQKFRLCKFLFERNIFVTEITYLLAKFWFPFGYYLLV